MRRFTAILTLVSAVSFYALAAGVEAEKPRSAVPEELVDAWERFQRALQDWGGRLRERFGASQSRETQPLITQMLNSREDLGLSPEQVKKLEQLRDNFQRQSIRNDADLRIVELDIAALLDQPTVDTAKVEAKIREAEKLRADLRIARIRTIEQGKALLTAEQRKKFFEADRSPRGRQNRSSTDREQASP